MPVFTQLAARGCRAFDDYETDSAVLDQLRHGRVSQLGNGVIPVVAPLPHVGFYDYCGRDCAAGWAECIAEIPYYHYMMYGDKTVIRNNLPALKQLLDYYEAESPDHIRWNLQYYGDWLSVNSETDISTISTMYYARVAVPAGIDYQFTFPGMEMLSHTQDGENHTFHLQPK